MIPGLDLCGHADDDRGVTRRRQHKVRRTGVGDQAERLAFPRFS
jgi:hypothetical protein